jgi:hypothetical protein
MAGVLLKMSSQNTSWIAKTNVSYEERVKCMIFAEFVQETMKDVSIARFVEESKR